MCQTARLPVGSRSSAGDDRSRSAPATALVLTAAAPPRKHKPEALRRAAHVRCLYILYLAAVLLLPLAGA